jgi:hypothetical protein
LLVASPEVPSRAVQDEVRKAVGMKVRFHLVTPSNYAELMSSISQ